MSDNFLKVKRKLIQDMQSAQSHTQASWADIMLKAAERCKSDEDQKDFFRFILNPNDSWDVPEPTFKNITDEDILIQRIERLTIHDPEEEKDSEITLHNNIHTNGKTTYISVTQEE